MTMTTEREIIEAIDAELAADQTVCVKQSVYQALLEVAKSSAKHPYDGKDIGYQSFREDLSWRLDALQKAIRGEEDA